MLMNCPPEESVVLIRSYPEPGFDFCVSREYDRLACVKISAGDYPTANEEVT
jgi:hypothetical protein